MILLTGASGFVGGALLDAMSASWPLRVVLRRPLGRALPAGVESIIAACSDNQDWAGALAGVEVVIHCAARAHQLEDTAVDPLSEFRKVNVEGSLNLAKQAAAAGVRRFVFISSIGVNGAETTGAPFRETDCPAPHSPYAVSKYEAELCLRDLAAQQGIELVILRPPLIYGAQAPGNFAALMRWLARGVPLPLGSIDNRRSLVGIENLVDLIVRCIDHPAAANETFVVSDGEDLSTTALLRRLGIALGRPARLLPVPARVLRLGASLVGRPELAQRLCASLQVDSTKARRLLDWVPPMSVDEGLRRTAARWLIEQQADA